MRSIISLLKDILIKVKELAYSLGLIADYVIEIGIIDGWIYRKWNSGLAECWRLYSCSVSKWSVWGNLYYAEIPSISYPLEFIEVPVQKVTFTTPAGSGWDCNCNNDVKSTGLMQIMRNNSSGNSLSVRVHITVVGLWENMRGGY